MKIPSKYHIHARSIKICKTLGKFPKTSIAHIHRRSIRISEAYYSRSRSITVINQRLHSPNALYLPISLRTESETYSLNALLDSGAEANVISHRFVTDNNIPTKPLKNPINLRNADSSLNTIQVNRTIVATVVTGHVETKIQFLVSNIGKSDAIIGYPWLRQNNPTINWRDATLSFPDSHIATPQPLGALISIPPSQTPTPPSTPSTSISSVQEDPLLRFTGKKYDELRKLVPKEFHEFLDIFSEEASSRMPTPKPWDHEIILKPGFKPKSSRVYPLSPEENRLTKEMIDEHLKRGTIRPSKSPQASGWFFVAKKDRKK